MRIDLATHTWKMSEGATLRLTLSQRTRMLSRVWMIVAGAAFLYGVVLAAWFVAVVAGLNLHLPGGKWWVLPTFPLSVVAGEALKIATRLSVRRDREAAGLENAKIYKWEWAGSALIFTCILTLIAGATFDWPFVVIKIAFWAAVAATVLLLLGLARRRWRKA